MARIYQTLCDVCTGIPRAAAGGSYEARVRRAVRYLWSRGIYPGVGAIAMRVHGSRRRDLNDREARWRNDEMLLRGISRQRRSYAPGISGRLEPTAATEVIRDLRQKLALAGVEGSPPPGEEATIPRLLRELREERVTVRSIAAVLGWENVPPRETLERSIAALKARK